ncbi:ribonuclease P protein component [Undibacter mobilis]|uniref:Ribonuclease P protein component n=1 Tax=Undibacter mobilis TaxID=2292256 RepID=A0A371BA88_9BRAD|nr:ribonuclease P protein component [Undibacter mobilis]RDV04498.1 ribonuclease P protein component [Undibacter mobilis]
MERLKQRADFLKTATGTRVPAAGFVLQFRKRTPDADPKPGAHPKPGTDQAPAAPGPARVGFTVSRKVGNAVERNRVRRRLREIVRLFGEGRMHGGYDYVLVGRQAALSQPFDRMTQDFERALRRAHDGLRQDGTRQDGTRESRGARDNSGTKA